MENTNAPVIQLPPAPSELLPPEIRSAFLDDEVTAIRRIGGGMVNATLYAEAASQRLVVQRLAPIFSPDMVQDYQAVTNHLRQDGWEMPDAVPTRSGRLTAADHAGNVWRAVTYLESDAAQGIRIEDMQDPETYGRLLGKLHASLRKFDYTPRFGLPHFHDTAYYAEQLAAAKPDIPTDKGRRFGAVLLKSLDIQPPLSESKPQLIHGDPRTANILHRDGKPFTFIDWDTLMKGSTWIDLGDMLRSVAEDAVLEDKPVPVDKLAQIAEGYRQAFSPETDSRTFQGGALRAAQTIALELAMRFVADYKDGDEGYFAWDTLHYGSRHEYTMDRATYQMAIFRQIQKYIKENQYD